MTSSPTSLLRSSIGAGTMTFNAWFCRQTNRDDYSTAKGPAYKAGRLGALQEGAKCKGSSEPARRSPAAFTFLQAYDLSDLSALIFCLLFHQGKSKMK
jgi:hypothetical protein